MNTQEAINFLEKQIPNPSVGLPEEVFRFISRLTSMVNIDLLIKDEAGRTLLSWRDDEFSKGWHVPGGIIRFKEDMKTRVQKVIETEIGAPVQFEPAPTEINQIICSHATRGHSISLLFKCFLSSKHALDNTGLTKKDKGYLKWHKECPPDLINAHGIYRKYM